MDKNSYKILSRHLAGKEDIQVIFEKDACPNTDGRTITLPTTLSDEAYAPLLGALLHETAHIRYSENLTNLVNANDLDQVETACLNVLEDIRIEYKTKKEYPHAPMFINALTEQALTLHKEQLAQEQIQVKALKSLILDAQGFEVKKIYPEEDALALFDTIKSVIPLAKTQANTSRLVELARRLAKKLRELSTTPEQQKAIDQMEQEREQMRQEQEKLVQENNEKTIQYSNEKAKAREVNAEKSEENRKAGEAEAKGDKAAAAQAKQKAEAADAKCSACSSSMKRLEQEFNENCKKEAKLSQERNKLAREIEKLAATTDEIKSGVDLNGFKAFNDAKINAPASEEELINIDSLGHLQDLLIDALIAKKNQAQEEDNGSKLNEAKIASYYDEDVDMFLQTEQKQENTHVTFIVDASGSMDDHMKGGGTRRSVVLNSTIKLVEALQKAIHETNVDCDFSIYRFARHCELICQNSKEYDSRKVKDQYFSETDTQGQYWDDGDTYIANAVNQVNKDLEANGARYNTAIVLSDANVGEYELGNLVNHAQISDNTKFLFIGIDADSHNKTSYKLFGLNNVQKADQMDEVLHGALLNAL